MSVLLSVIFFLLVSSNFGCGQECDSSGVRCVNCSTYQKCNSEVPDGEITGCENGAPCADSILERCKTKLNCYADGECTSVGIFPDPLVEPNFYVCLGDPFVGFVKYEFSCPPGQYFDAQTSMCYPTEVTDPTVTTSEPTTPEVTTEVTTPEVTTPEVTTPEVTTMTTTPLITTTTTTAPLTTTTTSTTSSSVTTAGTASPDACIMPGIFPVLTNCKLYYRCSTSLKLFYFTCPGNSYFNEMILKCSLTLSPTCKEQILKNTTSPLPVPKTTPITSTTSTTSSSTEVTTTTPIPTTSTTPVPPTSSSPITFVCPSIGTYEDPNNCKTYFRCSSSGEIFIFTCPGASYFNEMTKKCTLVLTPRCLKLIQS